MTSGPTFGQWFTNTVASTANPRRRGMYVMTVKTPHGRMNPGTWYELTDGEGDFWQVQPDKLIADESPSPDDVEGLRLERMAQAGQNIAQDWGHPEWSNSWADQVAAALYNAYRSVPDVLGEKP